MSILVYVENTDGKFKRNSGNFVCQSTSPANPGWLLLQL